MFRPVPESVLSRYPKAHGLPVEPLSGGLINQTYRVGRDFILQRLSPIFSPEVNLDIETLTSVLTASGVPVPTLERTRGGKLWVSATEPEARGIWRLMTRLPGRTLHRLETEAQAASLGKTLASFHNALSSFHHTFAQARPGIHETHGHMRSLGAALEQYPDHRLATRVGVLAQEIFQRWEAWGEPLSLPLRIGHGDPKVSNFLFDGGNKVVGVVDLDTMGWTSLDLELGDALRSWCNVMDENSPAPCFDLTFYAQAVGGYVEMAGSWLTGEEVRSIPAAVERICLELSARFAADALRESYFGWDPAIASTRGGHNLLRATGQLALARDVGAKVPEMADLLGESYLRQSGFGPEKR